MTAFSENKLPQISVYNQAKTPLGLDLSALVAALQKYVDEYLSPIWDCPATLNATSGPVAGTWGIVFLDNADEPGALAYHDEESRLPLAKVFVATTLQAGDTLASSASHELAEMLVDPACNRYAQAADGLSLYALEVCDACEESSFEVAGFGMSDFCLPAWFEPEPFAGVTQFDYCGVLKAPFSIASGGYALISKGGAVSQVFGSQAKAERFALEDRRGHRSELRRRATAVARK